MIDRLSKAYFLAVSRKVETVVMTSLVRTKRSHVHMEFLISILLTPIKMPFDGGDGTSLHQHICSYTWNLLYVRVTSWTG